MTDIFSQVYDAADRAICSIPDGWPYKILMGFLFIILSKHVILFAAFAAVVAIDLFVKFIALSYGMLKDKGMESPSLVDSIKAIPAAHRDRVINSGKMKTQFVGKMIIYIILVMTGGLADILIGGSVNFAELIVAYLASTEVLSIVENLDDAGVSALHDLVLIIKRKRGSIG